MNIAIDISPLENKGRNLSHRVRGTGFYIRHLKESLLKYFPENKYIFFVRGEKLPKNVDLVHYPYFEPFFITLPIQKKYKTVVTVHDLTPLVFPEHFPIGIKGSIKWKVQKLLIRRSEGIISDSICSKNDIIKFTDIPQDKIQVVYLAADEEFRKIQSFDKAQDKSSSASWRNKVQYLKKKYLLPDKFALYVGDVTWNKNIPRLVEAVKGTNIPLVMVGKALVSTNYDKSNPWNKDLALVQKLSKDTTSIIHLGFVPTEDLVLLYNIATCLIMPSLYEGFGLPILEAMQCGCPVITSKEGSIAEIADDAAYYVDAYNTESIKKGLQDVFFDVKLQKKLSKKGRNNISHFSWKKTALNTVQVYKDCLRYEKEN